MYCLGDTHAGVASLNIDLDMNFILVILVIPSNYLHAYLLQSAHYTLTIEKDHPKANPKLMGGLKGVGTASSIVNEKAAKLIVSAATGTNQVTNLLIFMVKVAIRPAQ
ncbi:hypothetical protein BDR06DRAFT_974774 [Suillus hirtellus]|nr:hypothetical protein BDR06DRAFT_974774 [Suillus hirtellus]